MTAPLASPSLLPLLDALRADARIAGYTHATCAEHRAEASISPALGPTVYLVIKPDTWCNDNVSYPHTPPSPDCVVVVRCADGAHTVYVVELKDLASQRHFIVEVIRAKFETCLSHFMSDVLAQHFLRDDVRLRVHLRVVADIYRDVGSAKTDPRLSKNSRFDALLALTAGRPLRFGGRKLGIAPYQKNPMIQPC